MKAVINGKLLMPEGMIEGKVLLFDHKIQDMADMSQLPDGIETIDARGCYVSPGFIDVHTHGSGGCDTMDGSMESLDTISRTLASRGVTSFLPTTMTMDMADIFRALDAIRNAMHERLSGAKVLGCHMEGPFISEKYKGAQNEKYIKKPDFSLIESYLDVIKIITIAPETDENQAFIKEARKRSSFVVSIGHSNATYDEAMSAISMGASHATHLFNAMSPLNHRNPGVVGAALSSDATCELIADNIHVNPAMYSLLLRIKGNERLILITDSMRAGCMCNGTYDLGGQKVFVKDGSARLEDGTLAGSILTMNEAVKNFMNATSLKLNDTVKLCTSNPAKLLGLEKSKGSLLIGMDADITILDENLDVKMTISEGNVIFQK